MDDMIPENPCSEVEPSVLYPSDDRDGWRIGLERLATKYFGPDVPFDPEDIFDMSDLRPRVVTTFKPTPRPGWTELLAEKTNGIFPPYAQHYVRRITWPAELAELMDGEHSDGGAQQPSS